mgnify:FL=1
MFDKLIFHTLKGIKGWSSCSYTKIDIGKIISIKYHERMFKIFNQDHDYTLTIEYDEAHTYTTLSPVIGGKGGFTVNTVTDTERLITKRYETLKDVEREIKEIKLKQSTLNNYINETRDTLSQQVINNNNTSENIINDSDNVVIKKKYTRKVRSRRESKSKYN